MAQLKGINIVWGVPPSDAQQPIDTGGLPYDLMLERMLPGKVRVHHRSGRRITHAIEVDKAGHWILGPVIEQHDQDRLDEIVEILGRLVNQGNTVSLVTGKASTLSPISKPELNSDRIIWAVEVVGPNLKTTTLPVEADTLKEAALAAETMAKDIAHLVVAPGSFELTEEQKATIAKIDLEKGES